MQALSSACSSQVPSLSHVRVQYRHRIARNFQSPKFSLISLDVVTDRINRENKFIVQCEYCAICGINSCENAPFVKILAL